MNIEKMPFEGDGLDQRNSEKENTMKVFERRNLSERQYGLKEIVRTTMETLIAGLENAEKMRKFQKDYRDSHDGAEQHEHCMYDLPKIISAFFVLVGLQTVELVTQEEIGDVSKALKEIFVYEDQRLEARANNYAHGKEERSQMVLKGREAILTKEMLAYFDQH